MLDTVTGAGKALGVGNKADRVEVQGTEGVMEDTVVEEEGKVGDKLLAVGVDK